MNKIAIWGDFDLGQYEYENDTVVRKSRTDYYISIQPDFYLQKYPNSLVPYHTMKYIHLMYYPKRVDLSHLDIYEVLKKFELKQEEHIALLEYLAKNANIVETKVKFNGC